VNTVVTQAMACGLAVITTRHSGLPEQVIDGVNGFVVDEGDWQALAERIIALASHPETLPEMSRAGRDRAARYYDATRLIDSQIAAYEELAGTPSRPEPHSG
jgi:glycosyltransferase involved in cell wall biosynthesis